MFSPVNSGDSSFEGKYDSYGSDEENEFSDKVFDSFDFSEIEDSSSDNRYNFDDDDDGEEFTLEDSLTWIAEELENEKVITKPNSGLKFVAGIAFLTGGIFLATRRISRID
jgi:hypothetical protein